MEYCFSVAQSWYDGVYRDQVPCCSAARSFSLLHETPSRDCWLILHGYRGYPGEFVRPAEDLYQAGFDVFVPRLPGHGTSGDDFIRSRGRDWMGFCENALADLKTRYDTVHILGHSMSAAVAAIIGCGDPAVGKLVFACPSFENAQMPLPARAALRFLSLFTPRVKCGWHPSSKYHLHYENAPCDDRYLGQEYWQYYFTRQLGDYYRILKQGLKAVAAHPHAHLVIYPLLDTVNSRPSVALYRQAVGERAHIVSIENGTHCVFYDKDPAAEEAAVQAVVAFALA